MQSNLEEIISYMHDKFRPYDVFDRQMKRITRELMELGYTLEEITRGINAYLLQLQPLGTDMRYREKSLHRERSFRILDQSESRLIGRDAYGYLCMLRGLGLINGQETEELINFIVENNIEIVDGEDLQSVMMDMVLEDDDDGRKVSGAWESGEAGGRNFNGMRDTLDRHNFWHKIRKRRLN